MASNRDLIERGIGVLATFAIFRTASKAALGISFPGTAAAVGALAAAAVCDKGEGGGVCTINRVANYPGNTAGRLIVGGAEKVMAMSPGNKLPAAY